MPISVLAFIESIGKFIANNWRPIALVVLVAIAYMAGAAKVKQDWVADNKVKAAVQAQLDAVQRAAMAQLQKQIADVNTKVVVEYKDRIIHVRDQATKLSKEVPIYVTPTDDSRCTVNDGFVRLWTETNSQTGIPTPPGSLNGTPTELGFDVPVETVKLSDIAAQHVDEVRVFNENTEQLRSLQSWVRKQDCAINGHCVPDPDDGIKAAPGGAAPQ